MAPIALPTSEEERSYSSKKSSYHRAITITSRLIVIAILVLASFLIFHHHRPITMSSSTPLSSTHKGWHSRAKPLYSVFEPTKDAASFGALLNSPVDPEGFSAGFFAPDVVVDARGVALKLDQSDWNAIVQLASQAVTDLPEAGGFRNQWRIKHDRTSYPIDWLRVKRGSDTFKEVSVYGYDESHDVLQTPVGSYTTLPHVLKELFGLLAEARDGYVRGRENSELINKVKAVLDV